MRKKKKCDICKKNEAKHKTIQYIDGVSKEIWVCDNCELLVGISDQFKHKTNEVNELEMSLVCPECLTNLTEFKLTWRLGCPMCYTIFAEQIEDFCLKVHSTKSHSVSRDFKLSFSEYGLQELQRRLDDAVKSEDYELAAKLRDEIKRIKK